MQSDCHRDPSVSLPLAPINALFSANPSTFGLFSGGLRNPLGFHHWAKLFPFVPNSYRPPAGFYRGSTGGEHRGKYSRACNLLIFGTFLLELGQTVNARFARTRDCWRCYGLKGFSPKFLRIHERAIAKHSEIPLPSGLYSLCGLHFGDRPVVSGLLSKSCSPQEALSREWRRIHAAREVSVGGYRVP